MAKSWMPNIYAFNQVAEAKSHMVDDNQTIFVFEMIQEAEATSPVVEAKINNQKVIGYDVSMEMRPTKYDVHDINRILTSEDILDYPVKAKLIAKMIELQDLQRGDKGDYKKRYQVLLSGLSFEALKNIRDFNYTVVSSTPEKSEPASSFVTQFLHDWANLPREDSDNYEFGGRLRGLAP